MFPRLKVAVFVNGCFWHGCPLHATWPVTNAGFWKTKIEGNRLRDIRNEIVLADAGWTVVRLWEHQPIEEMVRATFAVVSDARIRGADSNPAPAGR